MFMETNKLICVINESGEKVDLEFIDEIKMEGNEYVIVGPKNSDKAYAYKSIIENGETKYMSIGQGDEFKRVLQKYNQG